MTRIEKVVVIALVAIAAISAGRLARGHDIYGGWHPPGNPNASCCNDADCRPTRAFIDDDGRWRAWNGRRWLTVPWDRVLPTDFAGDGRSHLCEKDEHIYCFTPGPPRS